MRTKQSKLNPILALNYLSNRRNPNRQTPFLVQGVKNVIQKPFLFCLGQASDPHTIDNHLLSMFDNMRRVKFHEKEYNKMIAFMSSEGETIPLERSVRAEGSVESWLMALLVAAQASLHAIIRTAYTMIQDPAFNLLAFLEKMPAQVGLLGIQMIWTRDGESALSKARNDPEVMADNNNKCLKMLNTLIDQTTRDLTKIERTQFETLITIHVHQRDIFDILVICVYYPIFILIRLFLALITTLFRKCQA